MKGTRLRGEGSGVGRWMSEEGSELREWGEGWVADGVADGAAHT